MLSERFRYISFWIIFIHLKHFDYVLDIKWLGKDLVHSCAESFVSERFLDVPCDPNNLWLISSFNLMNVGQKGSDLFSSFNAIHNRHAKIHENKLISDWMIICVNNLIISFLSINTNICHVFRFQTLAS